MGIINLDPYTSVQGVTWTNAYMSIADALVSLVKAENQGTPIYELSCSFRVYYSQQARADGKPPVTAEYVRITDTQPFVTDIYDLLYGALKVRFPNSVDA